MRSQSPTYLTEPEFLRWEVRQNVRHEYVGGQVYAMTGASLRHNVIAGNIFAALRPQLRATPCRVFMESVKLKIARTGAIYYPDLVVSCDPRLREIGAEQGLLDQATVVIEVLSPSTEGVDRREKQAAYRSLPELREYVLIGQDAPCIEIYRRTGDIGWELVTLDAADPFELKSLEFVMPVAEVYTETGCRPAGA